MRCSSLTLHRPASSSFGPLSCLTRTRSSQPTPTMFQRSPSSGVWVTFRQRLSFSPYLRGRHADALCGSAAGQTRFVSPCDVRNKDAQTTQRCWHASRLRVSYYVVHGQQRPGTTDASRDSDVWRQRGLQSVYEGTSYSIRGTGVHSSTFRLRPGVKFDADCARSPEVSHEDGNIQKLRDNLKRDTPLCYLHCSFHNLMIAGSMNSCHGMSSASGGALCAVDGGGGGRGGEFA